MRTNILFCRGAGGGAILVRTLTVSVTKLCWRLPSPPFLHFICLPVLRSQTPHNSNQTITKEPTMAGGRGAGADPNLRSIPGKVEVKVAGKGGGGGRGGNSSSNGNGYNGSYSNGKGNGSSRVSGKGNGNNNGNSGKGGKGKGGKSNFLSDRVQSGVCGDLREAKSLLSKMHEKGCLHVVIMLTSPSGKGSQLIVSVCRILLACGDFTSFCDFLKMLKKEPMHIDHVRQVLSMLFANEDIQSHLGEPMRARHSLVKWMESEATLLQRSTFRTQEVMPSIAELISAAADALPLPHTKGEISCEEYLAYHFALLREDLLAPLREDMRDHLHAMSQQSNTSTSNRLRKRWFGKVDLQAHIPVGRNEEGGKKGHYSRSRDAFFIVHFAYHHTHKLANAPPKRKREIVANSRSLLPIKGVVAFVENRDTNPSVVALASIAEREEDCLSGNAPNVGIRFWDHDMAVVVLRKAKAHPPLTMVQLGGSLLAYPPVLKRLQRIPHVPFGDIILKGQSDYIARAITDEVPAVTMALRQLPDLGLDGPQQRAVSELLRNKVSLIQGPPGTGKTHVATHAVNLLYRNDPDERILLVAYTNHTIDQFMESLYSRRGIPLGNMVRFGGGCKSELLQDRLINPLARESSPRDRGSVAEIMGSLEEVEQWIRTTKRMMYANPSWDVIRDALERKKLHEVVAELETKVSQGGMAIVGKKGKKKRQDDKYQVWLSGQNKEGGPKIKPTDAYPWNLSKSERYQCRDEWCNVDGTRGELSQLMAEHAALKEKLRSLDRPGQQSVVNSCRIFGCTTTFLAENSALLESVTSVFIEEAGELLECSALTSLLTSNIRRVAMIGDHKQLRPKIESYNLTVESGGPYKFNTSMFERLIQEGYPHVTLEVQHRMRPEMSVLVRPTYDTYDDGPNVAAKPKPKGTCGNVVFVNHDSPENGGGSANSEDSMSKVNAYEVRMLVCMLRYFVQQGHSPGDIVLLTPYLGQLTDIRTALKKEKTWQAELSELDVAQLAKENKSDDDDEDEADDMPAESAEGAKVRLSTIDNFQGEEANIVIVSLVRCNPHGSIGFLKQPERVNVMLSRARLGLYMVGSLATLTRPAKSVWIHLRDLMKKAGQIHEGFPVTCGRHKTTQLLKKEEDFTTLARDGGCSLPCSSHLTCQHPCPKMCHSTPHTSIRCSVPVRGACSKDHFLVLPCHKHTSGEFTCPVCTKIERIRQEKDRRIESIQNEMDKKATQHDIAMTALEADVVLQEARLRALKEEQLCAAKQMALTQKAVLLKQEAEDEEEQKDVEEDIERLEQERKTHALCLAKEAAQKAKLQALREKKVRREAEGEEALRCARQQVQSFETKAQNDVETNERRNTDEKAKVGVSVAMREKLSGCCARGDMAGVVKAATDDAALFDNVFGWDGMHKMMHTAACTPLVGTAMRAAKELLGKTTGVLDALAMIPQDEDVRHVFLREYCQRVLTGSCKGLLASGASAAPATSYVSMVLALRANMESVIPDNVNLAHRFLCGCVLVSVVLLGRAGADASLQNAVFTLVAKDTRVHRETFQESVREVPVRSQEQLLRELQSNSSKHPVEYNATAARAQVEEHGWKRSASTNTGFKELVAMTGLRTVKTAVFNVLEGIRSCKEIGKEYKKKSYSMIFTGNPGTGKATVARLYCKAMQQEGLFEDASNFVETSGAKLISSGASAFGLVLQKLEQGGVMFIDEAYQLCEGNDPRGREILNLLLTEMEHHKGKMTIILAGCMKRVDELLSFNEGLPSQFPNACVFEDYTDEELLKIFEEKRLKDVSERDGKPVFRLEDSRYLEVAVRRVGCRRGPRFENARAMANLYDAATDRNAARTRTTGPDRTLTKQDLLGETSFTVREGAPYKALAGMTGLASVKKSVESLLDVIKGNLKLEEDLKPLRDVALNRVFIGNPGTGKTTVAKLYGQILKESGVLSKGDIIECTVSDCLGSVLGESAKKTGALLESAVGCVLVIDKAHGLDPNTGSSKCPYREEVVNTIVEKVSGGTREDRAVVLLGYTKEMEMMIHSSPGLQRRFQDTNAWDFEDFSDDELFRVLTSKIAEKQLRMGFDAMMRVVKEVLTKKRMLPNFGNAGEVHNCIAAAAQRLAEHTKADPSAAGDLLLFEHFTTSTNTEETDVAKLFRGLSSISTIVKQFEMIHKVYLQCKKQGKDPLAAIPMNFRFVGAPGTGKTTVAKRLAQLYKSLGVLRTSDVTIKSVSDFVTGCVGQDAIQTSKIFNESLGGVLVIGEAHRLSGEPEVLDEIVQLVTQDQGKMVLILTGHKQDVDTMLQQHNRLKSRVCEEVVFEDLSLEDSCDMLLQQLKEDNVPLEDDARSVVQAEMKLCLAHSSWRNRHDVLTLSKKCCEAAAEQSDGYLPNWALEEVFTAFRETAAQAALLPYRAEVATAPPALPEEEEDSASGKNL